MSKNKTQAGLLYLDANVWDAEIATFVLDLQRAGFISFDGPMLYEEILHYYRHLLLLRPNNHFLTNSIDF